jgi:hypothetical protein
MMDSIILVFGYISAILLVITTSAYFGVYLILKFIDKKIQKEIEKLYGKNRKI